MEAKTKKTIGIALLLIGAATLTYFLVIKPRKEKMSNASGVGKAGRNLGCPPGTTWCQTSRTCTSASHC